MVDGVVVGKLRQQLQVDPVVLLLVAKGSEVPLHHLVLMLGLTVCQRVECGREAVIDTGEGATSVRKSPGKLFVVIGGDSVRYGMVADGVFNAHSC